MKRSVTIRLEIHDDKATCVDYFLADVMSEIEGRGKATVLACYEPLGKDHLRDGVGAGERDPWKSGVEIHG